MSSTVPDTMRSLCIYSYRPPSEFEISTIPTPKMTLPNHVMIKVAAAGINPADMETARGDFKTVITLP
jgi:NADPH:quinone reductase-like Zn-dependent oxidoreductase